MNILTPDSWLRDYLKTKATPDQIAKALSLHSAPVEKIEQVNGDYVYNIEITTNRADMASVYGLAREIYAALVNTNVKAELQPYSTKPFPNRKLSNDYIKVKIVKTELCPRFTTILCGAAVKESPPWLKTRLKMAGINPHNTIVDVTNYVMLEIGQPMHAFDYDKIAKRTMTLRESKQGETITIIDGKKIELHGGDIVIADGDKKLIDLCGIKGGENSAIDAKTKNVLLFTQKYDPARIRKTIQSSGVRTEAATLFEKGSDPEKTVIALERAFELLAKMANAKMLGGLMDIYPRPYQAKKVFIDYNLIKAVSGVRTKRAEVKNVLRSLGFKISAQAAIVPSWRADDINIPQDIVEEFVRMYGYQNIPANIPPLRKPLPQPSRNYFYWENEVKNILKGRGFTEVYTYSLISQELAENNKQNSCEPLEISNPLTENTRFLRSSLTPSLLEVIEKNKNRAENLTIFELANIYLPTKEKNRLPLQKPMLTMVSNSLKLTELKQIIELLLRELGIDKYQFIQKMETSRRGRSGVSSRPLTNTSRGNILSIGAGTNTIPANRAWIKMKNKKIGSIYQLKSNSVAELDFQNLVGAARKFKKYEPVSKYPALLEDMTFTLPPRTPVGPVIRVIKKQSSWIKNVDIHDRYQNNATFRIAYRSRRKSLSANDVKGIRKRIIKSVEEKFAAELK